MGEWSKLFAWARSLSAADRERVAAVLAQLSGHDRGDFQYALGAVASNQERVELIGSWLELGAEQRAAIRDNLEERARKMKLHHHHPIIREEL